MRLNVLGALVLFLRILGSSAQTRVNFGASEGAFLNIAPSSALKWAPCQAPASNNANGAQRFECARLLVPFDHLRAQSDTRTFSIALTRLQAQDKTNYLGPIFVNPGGPGDSGTDFLFKYAEALAQQVGRGYDIVSWDPRGVGSTLPALSCFANAGLRTSALATEEHLYLFATNHTLDDLQVRQQSTAKGCQTYSSEILPFIGTMANVRDLNLINHLYGFSDDLTYLAYSYGAVLGSAYAATFPKNIKRIAVDGVLDVNRWFFDKNFFLTAYIDSDKVLDDFFNFCFFAGRSVCAFWHSSYAEIRQAFVNVDDKLRQSPSPAGPTRQLDWSQFRVYIWNALKNPVGSWTGAGGLDKFLALLEQDNLGKLTAAAADALFEYIAQGNHEITSNNTLVDPATGLRNGAENSEVIAAVDNPYSFGDIQSLLPFFQSPAAMNTGYLVQSILGTYGILSNYLKTSASERPIKPFANIRTSYPLLFISNLRDAFTPLQDALNTSSIFADSVVLRYNISGHTSGAAPSNCINQAVFAYFNNGTLPKPNTICEPDLLPFNLDLQNPQKGGSSTEPQSSELR
ncbi:MAG: hypothetical protein Q9225_001513 [Loekoesia sp. 1 TL-2023]